MEVTATGRRYAEALARSLPDVRDRVARAAERAGRSAADVVTVAVTKGHPFSAVQAALDAGIRHLGENRVEELESKRQRLGSDARAVWHLIGHVQRRKAERATQAADLFHAVDSVRLATRVASFRESGDPMPVLVQVNTTGEESKGGLGRSRAVDGIAEIAELSGLDVRGLMTMAPFTDDMRVVRAAFAGLREVHERARAATAYRGTELSMGMSNDFEIGIEEGGTLIRLGTALFGERPR